MQPQLYAFRVVLYVPPAVLVRGGVDVDPFHQWVELANYLRAAEAGERLALAAERQEIIEELTHVCYDSLESWPFYNDIDAPVLGFNLSISTVAQHDELVIELAVLGSTDQAASRAVAEKIRDDAMAEGCRVCIYEVRFVQRWLRPGCCWPDAPLTGYELKDDGDWDLSPESFELKCDSQGNDLELNDAFDAGDPDVEEGEADENE